jgi:hypothetical protein
MTRTYSSHFKTSNVQFKSEPLIETARAQTFHQATNWKYSWEIEIICSSYEIASTSIEQNTLNQTTIAIKWIIKTMDTVTSCKQHTITAQG